MKGSSYFGILEVKEKRKSQLLVNVFEEYDNLP